MELVLRQIRSAEAAVSDLERRLNITVRWTPSKPEWKEAAILVSERRYRKRLDQLELLVVSRLFELSKMNISQTGQCNCFSLMIITTDSEYYKGYKMRKHISKALQQRSWAIQTAIARYNEAARAMIPERPQLTWEQVLDYAFLADFDLLRGSRDDVRARPWANQTTRFYMDSWFKIQRAEEEIKRLNVEIRRVITHLHDERRFLTAMELKVAQTDPMLAFQIRQYCSLRTRFADGHIRRFQKLAILPGFTGSIELGVSVDRSLHVELNNSRDVEGDIVTSPGSAGGVQQQVELTGDETDDLVGDESDQEGSPEDDEERLHEKYSALVALTKD